MTKADKADVTWGDRDHKKGWTVRIQVGAEVIRRHLSSAKDAAEDAIRSMAIAAAQDDGYQLEPAQVEIHRP